MKKDGWRRTMAVAAHEGGVSCIRARVWIARWLLAAGTSAMVLLFALSLEAPDRFFELEESLRGAPGVFGLTFYLTLLFLVPWSMRTALDRGGRKGRLDLLAASPLTDFQVFAALVGGRLLSAMLLLFVLAPAVMTFAWLGRGDLIAHIIQVLGISLVAAWLATSYACFHAFLGARGGAVWMKLVLFITATPLALPHGVLAGILSIPILLILLPIVGTELAWVLAAVLLFASFPFWTLGICILEGSLLGFPGAVALSASLLLGLALSFEVARRFPRWLREREEGPEREVSSYMLRWRRNRLAEREAPPSWEGALGSYRRRRLSSMSRWVRGLYRLSGRSPYVVRELLRDDFRGEALGAALFVVFLLAWWNDLTFRAGSGSMPGAMAATFALVPCTFLAVLEASRALPPRGTTALGVFLSTPLTGGRIFTGSLLAAFLRFRFALLAVLGMGMTVRDGLDLARGAAFLLLFASILALAHGIGLWARLLGSPRGGGTALGVSACLFLGWVTVGLWPEGAPPHPLQAWRSPHPSAIFASGAMVALTALLLGTRFAAAFRRLAARGD